MTDNELRTLDQLLEAAKYAEATIMKIRAEKRDELIWMNTAIEKLGDAIAKVERLP